MKLSQVMADSDTREDAKIARAKLNAVYPTRSENTLVGISPEALVDEQAVAAVLGSVQSLCATTPEALEKKLQPFVASSPNLNRKEMEFWPLVKVVRIYARASALATGVVLVDLVSVGLR